MFGRLLNPLKTKSYFLFGPRGAGKTTWIRTHLDKKNILYLDLLDLKLQDELLLNPQRFDQMIEASENADKIIVIDEMQKVPKLLDRVHFHIEKNKRKFILTGSSARRLKQAGVNLLAGRALVYNLYPLSSLEIGKEFDLRRALENGGLPEAYLSTSEESKEYLTAYVYTYLEKEIQQEQWVRKIEPFRKFLAIAAQMNGKIINRSKIAKEVGVDDMTIASYYEILEDTLMGISLPAYHKSLRKAQRQAPKFYFIDTGLKRGIDKTLRVPLLESTAAFGDAFEHWVFLEIYKAADYKRLDWTFFYIRTKDDAEIDLVIERPGEKKLLIEIKSKEKVTAADAKTLESLGHDLDPKAERYILSRDKLQQKFGKTITIHWQDALKIWFE